MAIVVLGAVLAWRFGGGADVRATVAAAGMWAPLVFLGVHTLVTVSPVPRTIFTVAAGVLFGSVAGLLLTVTATMLSAVAAFWLVRVAGAGLVERYAMGGHGGLLEDPLERKPVVDTVELTGEIDTDLFARVAG